MSELGLGQYLTVFHGADMRVVAGANLGDPLSFATELLLDDIYALRPTAKAEKLRIKASPDGVSPFVVAKKSPVGNTDNQVHLDCLLTLMSPDGSTTEALVLVEVNDGHVVAIYLLPFADLTLEMEYTLVGIDSQAARQRLAEVSCVAFTRGTRITLGSGALKPIEDLRPGDLIMTRYEGPQEIRWIGHNTVRAVGEFAPILISQGVLSNADDLVVSPDHRLFIYQRDDELGAGRAEVMVKARHLVNNDTVMRLQGGYVDYFQLVFDRHQIIYAEGIAAESLMIDARTGPALPPELAAKFDELLPAHMEAEHLSYEIPAALLRGLGDPVKRLHKTTNPKSDGT
ncbi:MAG: Hint domain-containing protein [Pseudomonadota bacterium]